jgi:phospholipid transport system transporter-binding protein
VIAYDAGRARVTGAMTMANAAALRPALDPHLADGAIDVDLGAVVELDSSALAVMLEWRRAAAARRCTVRYVGVPANLRTLADLYGVADLLL